MRTGRRRNNPPPNVVNVANGLAKAANAVPFFGRFAAPLNAAAGFIQEGVGRITGRESMIVGGRDLAIRSVAAAVLPVGGGLVNAGGAIEDFSGANAGDARVHVDVTFETKQSPREFCENLMRSPSGTIGLVPTNVRDHGDGSHSGQPFPVFGPKVHTLPHDIQHGDDESSIRLKWLDDGQVHGETLFVARRENGKTVVRETGELNNATGWLPTDWVEGGHALTLQIGYAGGRR